MIYPKFLKENATIGVPTPSDAAGDKKYTNKYNHAIKYLEKNNYKLKLSKNLFSSNMGRSSDAETRGKELNEMFKDKNIDFILCASGGEFLIECLPYVDFDLLKDNPKFVAGFSDPTGILFPITTKYDIATIYGKNFGAFGMSTLSKSHYDFLDLINESKFNFKSYPFYEKDKLKKVTGLEPYNLKKRVKWKTLDEKEVNIKGRIIGGCFDLIADLMGTKYDGTKDFIEKYKNDGIIWFFDNCQISFEETIRILWKMNELDYFKYSKGIIFGRFGVDSSYLDYDTKKCLEDSVISKLNIPIIYDADISHKAECLPILIGSIANVTCSKNKGTISFELK